MRIADAKAWLEKAAPLQFAEPWDNVGLLFGEPDVALQMALFCVDLTLDVVHEARELGANFVFSYHPPLFRAAKKFGPEDVAFQCMRSGIAVYSAHTAFDVVEGGTNASIAALLRLQMVTPVRARAEDATIGMGRIGTLPTPMTSSALVEQCKQKLGLSHALVSIRRADSNVSRVAIVAGSGGDFLADAHARGAEVFITGELRHHDVLAARQLGMDAVCLLHTNSERGAVHALADRAAAAWRGVAVRKSVRDVDPLTFG